jgi:hypothetical protein
VNRAGFAEAAGVRGDEPEDRLHGLVCATTGNIAGLDRRLEEVFHTDKPFKL